MADRSAAGDARALLSIPVASLSRVASTIRTVLREQP
jgi:hypothetical protein